MDMSKYVKMFVSESYEHLQKMDGLLLALEQNGGDRTAIDTLFREAHSVKGMSASMGYDELAKVSHRMEDYLDRFRGGKGALERHAVDLLLEGVDLLRKAVEEIAGGQAPSLRADAYVAKMTSLLTTGRGGDPGRPRRPPPLGPGLHHPAAGAAPGRGAPVYPLGGSGPGRRILRQTLHAPRDDPLCNRGSGVPGQPP
jgi:two-component system chemotaxis sensor kinase CheA